jgi:integrase
LVLTARVSIAVRFVSIRTWLCKRSNGSTNPMHAIGFSVYLGLTFRFHDLRHCAITQLAENCTSDSTIMAIAGHVSRSMLIARDTNCPMANIKRIS